MGEHTDRSQTQLRTQAPQVLHIGPLLLRVHNAYPRNAFSKNGRDTIVPKRNVRIGQRDALAACDIRLVERMFRDEFRKR